MSKEIGVAAVNLAVETIQNTLAIEQENKNLKDQLSSNLKIIDDLEIVIPRAQALQNQLKEKKDLIEQKRQELINLQKSVITALIQKPEEGYSEASFEAIPIVMNRIQRYITDLTDAAVDNKTIAIPLVSLVKINEALDRLYDASVDSQVIKETKEERDERIKNNTATNKSIIEKIQENALVQQYQQQQQQKQQLSQLRDIEEEDDGEEIIDPNSEKNDQPLKRDVLLPSLKEAAEKAEDEEKNLDKSKAVTFSSPPPTITPSPVASAIAHRPPTPEPNFQQKQEANASLNEPTPENEANTNENKE